MDLIMEQELSRYLEGDPDLAGWPYPMYERWRTEHPVYRYAGGPAVVLTRYQDVRRVMGDGNRISNDGYRHGALADGVLARLPASDRVAFYDVMDFSSKYISRTDGAYHARLRRVASRGFTPARIRALQESIKQHVDELLDSMRDYDTPDVKEHLANQLPIRVVTDLIGVPAEDRAMIWQWSEAIANNFSVDTKTLNDANDAINSFRSYVHELVERLRRTDNRTELAMVLLDGNEDERLTEEELVVMFVLLLFAGSETTTNLLGNGFLALQRHRDQWNMIRDEPALVTGAVDEALRYDAPLQYLPRVAVEEMTFGGVQVKPGESVIIFIGAANRDPEIFKDPDTFDIKRSEKGRHLALAFGPHFCLGSSLVRIEGEIAFGSLIQRFPDAQLTTDDIQYGGSAMLRKALSLPTALGRERRVS